MPSVYTIEGPPKKRRNYRRRSKNPPKIGTCKWVKGGRGGKGRRRLCYTDQGATGWTYVPTK